MNVYLKKQNFVWRNVTLGIIGVILLVVLLNVFSAPIKNTFYFITSPIQKLFWNSGESVSGFFGSFLNAKSLTQENNNLKEENQHLLSQIFALQDTIQQNQLIQLVVKNTEHDNFKMVLGQAIGLEDDVLLLNKGSDDGILENMPVISEQKAVYGKVFKVYKNFSKVMLISNKNSVVDAKIQQTDVMVTPIVGAIKGSGNASLYLDLVATDASLQEGNILITSGLEGVFPKDLLIGKITSIDKNDLKPFQTARITPFSNIRNVNNLFIITNYKK